MLSRKLKHPGNKRRECSRTGPSYLLNKTVRESFTEKETFEERSEGGKAVSKYLGEEKSGHKILQVQEAGECWHVRTARRAMWLK